MSKVVAGRFALEARVGVGAMGAVYKATDARTGGAVAVKQLRDGYPVDRFHREARVLAELRHPGIVGYVDHGVSDGTFYLAMEWLEGEDLSQRLARAELSLDEAITLGQRVAEALAVAHAAGVVHRDLKPANLFLPSCDPARVKILDFGIARQADGSDALTAVGMVIGTPGYMAPEQARGLASLGPRADVFSLGCILYRCAARAAPFSGDSLVSVLAKVVFESPPRPRDVTPEVPAALDALIVRMMAKAAEDRPADAAEIVLALGRVTESTGRRVDLRGAAVTSALTGAERRLVSVVLLAPAVIRSDASESLREVAQAFGAEGADLLDGSFVAALKLDGEPSDQAAQAARCAFALRAARPERAAAIATGREEVGRGSRFGEVMDEAARALGAGPSASRGDGSIRLDDLTAGLLEGRFEIGGDERGLFLRREREPYEAAVRTLLGRPTPCVGRTTELAALEAQYEASAAGRGAQAAVVLAPAGIGKSRLRHEFLLRASAARDRPSIWIARGEIMGANSPFRMIGQILRQAFGLFDGEPAEVRRHKIRARLGFTFAGPRTDRIAPFLGELCGVPFTPEERERLRSASEDAMRTGDLMRRAWEDFVYSETGFRPALVVLEDLHWGDRASINAIDAALRNLDSRRWMVLALGRPEVAQVFPDLWTERAVARHELRPLSRETSTELVRAVLGGGTPPGVEAEIVARAEGNAFYLEEMMRVVTEARGDHLPETALSMAQARIAGMPPDARRVLRAASVFGQVFWTGGVRALTGEALAADRWLQELIATEAVSMRRDSRFPGEQEIVFRHGLLRDAAYAMLTEEDRELGHRLAGEWLLQQGETDPLLLAEHLVRGGDRARAAVFYLRSAEQALEGNDFEAALERVSEGLATTTNEAVRGALWFVQAAAHKWLGNNVEARSSASAALSRLPPGSPRWLAAAADLATVSAKMGDHENLMLAAEKLGRRSDVSPSAYVIAAARVAIQLLHGGKMDAADDLLAAAHEVAGNDPSAQPLVAACLHQARGVRANFRGDLGAFLGFTYAAAQAFEQAGDLRSSCTQRANVGYATIELGAYDAAVEALAQALTTAEELGLRDLIAGVKHNLGLALARAGKLEEGRALEVSALRTAVAQQNRRLECGCRTYLAFILLGIGDPIGAEREARAAVEVVSVAPPMRAHALAVLGNALLDQGRLADALGVVEEAITLAESLGGVEEGESILYLTHVDALVALGRRDEARESLRRVHARLLTRAALIEDPGWRESFLQKVPENARLLALAASELHTS